MTLLAGQHAWAAAVPLPNGVNQQHASRRFPGAFADSVCDKQTGLKHHAAAVILFDTVDHQHAGQCPPG
jgi:hypothetical protein